MQTPGFALNRSKSRYTQISQIWQREPGTRHKAGRPDTKSVVLPRKKANVYLVSLVKDSISGGDSESASLGPRDLVNIGPVAGVGEARCV